MADVLSEEQDTSINPPISQQRDGETAQNGSDEIEEVSMNVF